MCGGPNLCKRDVRCVVPCSRALLLSCSLPLLLSCYLALLLSCSLALLIFCSLALLLSRSLALLLFCSLALLLCCALAMIHTLARSEGSKRPQLDFIALALSGKKMGFGKIIKMIDDMIANLKEEQADDDGKMEFCTAQLDAADDKKNRLSVPCLIWKLERGPQGGHRHCDGRDRCPR